MEIETISVKEKRERALSVRLPKSSVEKVKYLSKKYKRSQSEIIEYAIKTFFKFEEQKKNAKSVINPKSK
ncbi:ribbon-helix-helix protein, CopG family [bacterium]|nr:ribbon-helix-helix protein, CopG family [bacterium]